MRIGGRLGIALFPLAVLAFAQQAAHAQGGPPLLTDDPATPGNGHQEINVGFTLDRNPATTLLEAPRLDVNYGLGDHIQLKYEIPWLVLDRGRERTRSGLANSPFGVKWRFADEERRGVTYSFIR